MSANISENPVLVRISADTAEVLHEAADLAGMTPDDFADRATLRAAQRIVEHERDITLTEDDMAMLVDLLDQPPAPNAALARAFQRYRGIAHDATDSAAG